MKKGFAFLLSVILLLSCAAVAEEPCAVRAAAEILDALANGRYEEVYSRSTPPMQEAIKASDGYADLWSQLSQYGAYEGTLDLTVAEENVYTTVLAACQFGETILTLQITLDENMLFNGFFINALLTRPTRTQE